MKLFSLLFIFLFLFSSAQVKSQVTEKNYKIYSVKQSKEVTINDIVEEMKNNDVLFYGEEHNESEAVLGWHWGGIGVAKGPDGDLQTSALINPALMHRVESPLFGIFTNAPDDIDAGMFVCFLHRFAIGGPYRWMALRKRLIHKSHEQQFNAVILD